MALIGANGAGKSSILRAITGLRKIRPVIARRIEDLPAPFAPISATVSPSISSSDTLAQRVDLVIVKLDARKLRSGSSRYIPIDASALPR